MNGLVLCRQIVLAVTWVLMFFTEKLNKAVWYLVEEND